MWHPLQAEPLCSHVNFNHSIHTDPLPAVEYTPSHVYLNIRSNVLEQAGSNAKIRQYQYMG